MDYKKAFKEVVREICYIDNDRIYYADYVTVDCSEETLKIIKEVLEND